MALLKIYCPSCKTGYEIDDSLSGEKVECGVCSKKFLVQKQEERATLRRNSALTIDDANKFWGKSISPEIKPYVSIRPDNISSGTIPDIKPRGMKLAESSTSSTISHDIVLLKQIGSGSMGQVHRSLQSSVDRNVAVKTLEESIATDESSRNSFIREALVTASLDHPNIVPVHELAIDENGRLFYSMKELKGKSWEDAMDFIQLDENLEILLKTCDAVAFAHARDVVHRDLKPENVMLGEFGEVLVMDWGLAVSVTPQGKAKRLEAGIGPAGTPASASARASPAAHNTPPPVASTSSGNAATRGCTTGTPAASASIT